MTTAENTLEDALTLLAEDNSKRRKKLFSESSGVISLEPGASLNRATCYLRAIADHFGLADQAEHEHQITLSKMIDGQEAMFKEMKVQSLRDGNDKLHLLK